MNRHNVQTPTGAKQIVRVTSKKARLPCRCCKRGNAVSLQAPVLDSIIGTIVDPSLQNVVIRVAPYAGMTCGDRLVLSWTGLDMEGEIYSHEVTRFVSHAQLGKDVVFVVRSAHIAALDGGSLEVFWTLTSARHPEPVTSARVALDVGDVRYSLLPATLDDAIGGYLDPARVTHGTTVSIGPYAWMTAGDRVCLSWAGASADAIVQDQLLVEPFSVGHPLVFSVAPETVAASIDSEVVVRYCIERRNAVSRESGITRVMCAPQPRGLLDPPQILEATDGELDLRAAVGGICVLISNAQVEEGELVYFKCDGESYSHREDRDITGDMALQPLVFNVPHEFWQEHVGTEVRVSYSVERLDDVSQLSGVALLRVQA